MPDLLLAVLAVVAPISVPPMPTSLEEACDPAKLEPMASAPPSQAGVLMSNVDRRIQMALFEERQLEPQIAERGQARQAATRRARVAGAATALVAVVAIGLGIAASRRRRSMTASAVAWALAAVAGLYGWRQLDARSTIDAERQTLLERALSVTNCHVRLTDTRGLLQHTLLAHYAYELDETDEDVVAWASKVRGGGSITIEDIDKMHNELRAAMKQ